MKRRNFLIGGIAASAAVRAWPFRVYSFPSQIAIIDFEAEKARFVRLARIAIDEEVARGGIVAPFFFVRDCAGAAPHNYKGPHVLLNPG